MADSDTETPVFIFSSKGGGGHTAAAEALKEALGDVATIEVYNALSEVFGKVDLLSTFTRRRFTAEDFYNFILKRRFFRFVNFYGKMGQSYMAINHKLLVKAALQFLAIKKPRLLISVIPFFNGALLEACYQLSIPFWIIPTDVELKTFMLGLDKALLAKADFTLGLAYPWQIKQALEQGISQGQIKPVGFPVKKACVHPYTDEQIRFLKQSLKVGEGSRVITLTLGAAGTSLFYKLAKELLKLSFSDIEFNCCAGRDKHSWDKLMNHLEKIAICEYTDSMQKIYRLSNGSRFHLWSFTPHLPKLMAISDLVISKTGSLSVSEALYLNKYLLLDHTINSSSRRLIWEKANLPFVESMQKGEGFYSKKDLMEKIEAFLNTPKELSSRSCFLNIHEKLPEALKELLTLTSS